MLEVMTIHHSRYQTAGSAALGAGYVDCEGARVLQTVAYHKQLSSLLPASSFCQQHFCLTAEGALLGCRG